MPLPYARRKAVVNAAAKLPLDHSPERIEDFVARVLHLTQVQKLRYFPDPDPTDIVPPTIAQFTSAREQMLMAGRRLPSFIITTDQFNRTFIQGLKTYLSHSASNTVILDRIGHHEAIRKMLLSLQRGDHLEALAAAILEENCSYGCATQRGGDQGIDALGWNDLLPIDRAFIFGNLETRTHLPGARVFILTSAKANLGNTGAPETINPAWIRELVGGWLIQRTGIGAWREHGILMLSPVQLVLATTYKLSPDAKFEAMRLGVQIWGIAELIYLVCLHAPLSVFPIGQSQFVPSAFRQWWGKHDLHRVKAAKRA